MCWQRVAGGGWGAVAPGRLVWCCGRMGGACWRAGAGGLCLRCGVAVRGGVRLLGAAGALCAAAATAGAAASWRWRGGVPARGGGPRPVGGGCMPVTPRRALFFFALQLGLRVGLRWLFSAPAGGGIGVLAACMRGRGGGGWGARLWVAPLSALCPVCSHPAFCLALLSCVPQVALCSWVGTRCVTCGGSVAPGRTWSAADTCELTRAV